MSRRSGTASTTHSVAARASAMLRQTVTAPFGGGGAIVSLAKADSAFSSTALILRSALLSVS